MKVRKIRNAAGNVRWQLDLGMVLQADGSMKRVQKYFRTQDEAKTELANSREKRQAHGDAAITLSEGERIRFTAARDKLAAAGGTIEQAVELFVRHSTAMRESVTLIDLLERCICAKEKHGASLRYLQQFRCSCLNFIRGRESTLAHTVTRDEVRSWVLGAGWAPKTQRVYLGDLRTLFAWALAERHVAENPAAGDGPERIALAKLDDTPIARLSVDVVTTLLRRAARVPSSSHEDFRCLVWYVVLGTFAGVRPWELSRIDRSAVDLNERHVVVDAKIAKTRQRRVVDLSKHACAWLALDPERSGPVLPPNARRRWGRLRKAVGQLATWPHDAMRHTFASMHYAQHQDEAALKAQMGHSKEEETLMRHYRAMVTRKEAKLFWAYKPSAKRSQLWTTVAIDPQPRQGKRKAAKKLR
jgi:integrase